MLLTLPKISAKGPAGPVAPLTDARLAAEASAASRPLDSMVIFRSLPNGDFWLAPTALFCHGCSRVSSRKKKGEKTDLGASHLAFFGHLEQQLKHKISWYARATWATGVPCNLESALGMGMSANPSVQRNCCHAIGYLQSCCLLPRSELWKSIGSLPHEHKLAIVGRFLSGLLLESVASRSSPAPFECWKLSSDVFDERKWWQLKCFMEDFGLKVKLASTEMLKNLQPSNAPYWMGTPLSDSRVAAFTGDGKPW